MTPTPIEVGWLICVVLSTIVLFGKFEPADDGQHTVENFVVSLILSLGGPISLLVALLFCSVVR